MGQLATGRFRPLTFTRHRLSPLAVFTSGDPSSLISLVVSVDVKHHVYLLTSRMTSALKWAAVRAIIVFKKSRDDILW